MALFLIFLVAAAPGVLAQVSKTIQSADASVTNVVPLYDNRAERAWLGQNGMHDLYLMTNAARAQLALDLAPLVPANTAAVLAAALAPEVCSVNPDPLAYMNNATASQVFVCCQSAVWLPQALPTVLGAVYSHFFTGAASFDWSTATALTAIGQLRAVDVNNTNIVPCKDDRRIHIPEAEVINAKNIATIIGPIMRALNYASDTMQSCAACLGASPPPACIATTPSTLGPAAAAGWLAFSQASPPYQAVCSAQVLAAFEKQRAADVWCPIPSN